MKTVDILDSLEGIKRAELSPFVKAKISNSLLYESTGQTALVNKYTLVFACSLLLVAFNLFFLTFFFTKNNKDEPTHQNTVEQFSKEYNLNNVTLVNF